MQEIVLDIPWDDRRATLVISNVSGAVSDTWYVYLDNYYEGSCIFVNNEWVSSMNAKSELTYDDQEIIKELIMERVAGLEQS